MSTYRELLNRITYKDNYKLEVIEDDFNSRLIIRVRTKDTYNPDRNVIIQHNYPINHFLHDTPDNYKIDFIRNCIHTTERHEADEWLRLDGEIINNPHKDN